MTDVDIHPDWWNQAACIGMPPDTFFPKTAPTNRHDPYTHARIICGRCPVRTQCLSYARDNRIHDGMWGGLTPDERAPKFPNRICEECGGIFNHGVYSRARFCSKACQQRSWARRNGGYRRIRRQPRTSTT